MRKQLADAAAPPRIGCAPLIQSATDAGRRGEHGQRPFGRMFTPLFPIVVRDRTFDMGPMSVASPTCVYTSLVASDLDLPIRPRRLRQQPQLRQMLRSIELRRSDFIVPLFVCEGKGQRREVSSMPGVFQMSVDVATDWLAKAQKNDSERTWFSASSTVRKRMRPDPRRSTKRMSSAVYSDPFIRKKFRWQG